MPANDEKPLYSSIHNVNNDWGFKIRYIGRLNRVLNWVYLMLFPPKMREDNLEKMIIKKEDRL